MLLSCNPLLINPSGTYAKNTVISASLRLQSKDGRAESIDVSMTLNLRTNAEGKIVNYDLSPILAGLCRQYFIAQKYYNDTPPNMYNPYSQNQYTYALTIGGSTVSEDVLLFGAGEIKSSELVAPYLLRRNTSTIHVYKTLPSDVVIWNTLTGWHVYDKNMERIGNPQSALTGRYLAFRLDPYIIYNGMGVGEYYLSAESPFNDLVWKDGRTWRDTDIWSDDPSTVKTDAVFYPLVVHPDPSDCIRAGAKIYVRYWNSRGAWSYALLDVLHNDLKAKTEYADSWRLGFASDYGRVYGDRVQTDKEMTYTITAGRGGLDRLEVDELRDMQRAYCVQVWDVVREVWRDCYVQDATTQNNGGRGQEMTFTIEMPHEYTFTR